MHIQCFIKRHIPAQRHNRYICSKIILFILLLQTLPEPHGKRPKDLLPLKSIHLVLKGFLKIPVEMMLLLSVLTEVLIIKIIKRQLSKYKTKRSTIM